MNKYSFLHCMKETWSGNHVSKVVDRTWLLHIIRMLNRMIESEIGNKANLWYVHSKASVNPWTLHANKNP